MKLWEYFEVTKPKEREVLARLCGVTAKFLYHCSRGERKPSPALARLLVLNEPRLTLPELRPDLWSDNAPAPVPDSAQVAA